MASAVASTGLPRRRRIWLIGGAIAIAAIAATVLIVIAARDHRTRQDPWGLPSTTLTTTPAPDDPNTREGLAVAKGMLGLFDRVLTKQEQREQAAGTLPARPSETDTHGRPPTTAAGWLDLAESQPPAEALLSVRQALALQPTWGRARDKQCELLARLGDPEAPQICIDVDACKAGRSCSAQAP